MSVLAIAPVTAKDATPDRWLVFLHGILGSGANWRSFARQIVSARPRWGALLVDMRLHGDSLAFAPPHTLASAARDIVEALEHAPPSGRVRAVLGHSFGGKVGIELARQLAAAPNGAVDQLFVVDSTPGARPDQRGSSGVREVVELLTQLPQYFPDRNAFTAWVEERGVSRPTAMWLAMNVRPVTGDPSVVAQRFEFRIDIPSVREMMNDYFARDLWDVLERPPSEQMSTHLIAGGTSEVVDARDLERARACPRATVDVIADAGHWVHVDAPDTLRELVLRYLDA